MNILTAKLLSALASEVRIESLLEAEDIVQYIELEEGQRIAWLSSTWISPHLVNVFTCQSFGESPDYFISRHSDGGRLSSIEGPFRSLAAAKSEAGMTTEGWTDL